MKCDVRWLDSSRAAFTLVEALVSVSVIGVLFTALLAGISYGVMTIQRSREQMRATQIMVEKLDTIRLYPWSQVTQPGYISNTFTASYYPSAHLAGTAGFSDPGLTYTGTVTIVSNPITISYGADLRRIQIDLQWASRGKPQSASMNTLVSRYGLLRYVN